MYKGQKFFYIVSLKSGLKTRFYKETPQKAPAPYVSRETYGAGAKNGLLWSFTWNNMAEHNKIGEVGEDIAASWCAKQGWRVLERNYRKKYGELDIVARETGKNGKKLHFIEVKSVSYGTKRDLERYVSRGTHRPEENVHKNKQIRLSRTIETWLLEHDYEGKWQIDIVTVTMVPREKYAKVQLIENVVFE